jgi:hypothetical protein
MSPEEAQAVWALQATHVAGKLELSKEQTTKLVDANKKARESYVAAIRAAMEEARENADPDDRGAMYRAMREVRDKLTKAETDKLAKAVGAFLDKDKTKEAVKHLGVFSGSLDGMVNVIAGLKLDKAKQAKALDIVYASVAESTAALAKARASGDMETMRDVYTEQRAKLNEAMGKVLSEEQMTKWTEATARRGRGGGRRGPGGGARGGE